MLNNIILYVIIALVVLCIVFFFVARHFHKKYETTIIEYHCLHNKYTALERNYNTLQAAIQAKKEVQDEKDKKLTEIANGSADDAILRLQNRNNKRSN